MSVPSVEARRCHPLSRVCLAPLCTSPSFLQSDAIRWESFGQDRDCALFEFRQEKDWRKGEAVLI
jgi:hypothetical protein